MAKKTYKLKSSDSYNVNFFEDAQHGFSYTRSLVFKCKHLSK